MIFKRQIHTQAVLALKPIKIKIQFLKQMLFISGINLEPFDFPMLFQIPEHLDLIRYFPDVTFLLDFICTRSGSFLYWYCFPSAWWFCEGSQN